VFQPAGASAITLEASPSEPTRVLVLGGKPFGEQIVMRWNFIGRSHEEVVAFREEWQRQRAQQQEDREQAGAHSTRGARTS